MFIYTYEVSNFTEFIRSSQKYLQLYNEKNVEVFWNTSREYFNENAVLICTEQIERISGYVTYSVKSDPLHPYLPTPKIQLWSLDVYLFLRFI